MRTRGTPRVRHLAGAWDTPLDTLDPAVGGTPRRSAGHVVVGCSRLAVQSGAWCASGPVSRVRIWRLRRSHPERNL
jgi:hypothetical protein